MHLKNAFQLHFKMHFLKSILKMHFMKCIFLNAFKNAF
jgi:hypothetical protein